MATIRSGSPADGARRWLALFLDQGCDGCEILLADLNRRTWQPPGIDLYAIAHDPSMTTTLPLGWTVVLDADDTIARAWRVNGRPFTAVVDATDHIVATGFPNSRRDLDHLIQTAAPHRHDHHHPRTLGR